MAGDTGEPRDAHRGSIANPAARDEPAGRPRRHAPPALAGPPTAATRTATCWPPGPGLRLGRGEPAGERHVYDRAELPAPRDVCRGTSRCAPPEAAGGRRLPGTVPQRPPPPPPPASQSPRAWH